MKENNSTNFLNQRTMKLQEIELLSSVALNK